MTSPLVTILLPTYRRPQLLARALRSILSQTWQDFTVLVCDNNSADGTADVVTGFSLRDPRVVYHCHSQNIGAQANFGWAFAQVRSEYFCLFSDDDILLSECLAIEIEGLRRHPQAMAWGGIVLTTGDGGFVGCLPPPAWPEGFSDPSTACGLVCRNIRPANTGMLFKREVLDADFHPVFPDFHCSDALWMMHAAAKGGIGITSQPVAVVMLHAGSLSTRAGNDPELGMELYWPSVNLLHDHFPQGRLSDIEYVSFRHEILIHYGREQFRHLGRMAAIQGRKHVSIACIGRLEVDFNDFPGARRVARLAAVPPILLRLYFGLRYRLLLLLGIGQRRGRRCYQRLVAEALRM